MPDNTFFFWKTGILLELKDQGGDLKGNATLISSLKKTTIRSQKLHLRSNTFNCSIQSLKCLFCASRTGHGIKMLGFKDWLYC